MTANASLITRPIEEVDTPALVIDLDAMEDNLAKMADYFRGREAKHRPHIKTHKSPLLARRQLEAGGAIGITCQKLEEAETMIEGGIDTDILITNQIVTPIKIKKLVTLVRQWELTVCVDNERNIEDLSEAASDYGVDLGVLVEVNLGLNRCGVDDPEDALELAQRVSDAKGLRFRGLQGFEGHLFMIEDFEERRAAVHRDIEPVLRARELITGAGIPVEIVDGGGTTTYNITGEIGGIDEVQAGTYIFMDALYSFHTDFVPAVTVLTSVVSTANSGRVVTDAGVKAVSNDEGAMPVPKGIEGVRVSELHEEHGILELDDADHDLHIGDQVQLIPGHICTTVNLHDRYIGVRKGEVESVWPIPARGKFR